jgi:alkanesulfonate monooxygenase SsuD/methylene tetrahydromethanopterin reductase-like flavin-dependent oxidoreductase (luciferase family)
VRAARYGLPLMLAVIGGNPLRFKPYVDLYHRALDEYGFSTRPVGMHSHGYVARTDEEAVEIQFPHWAHTWQRLSDERGWTKPTLEKFQLERRSGALYVGSPETVANKMSSTIRQLGLSRFDLSYATGRVPFEQRLATIDLFGREVIPRVRQLLEDVKYDPKVGDAATPVAKVG